MFSDVSYCQNTHSRILDHLDKSLETYYDSLIKWNYKNPALG